MCNINATHKRVLVKQEMKRNRKPRPYNDNVVLNVNINGNKIAFVHRCTLSKGVREVGAIERGLQVLQDLGKDLRTLGTTVLCVKIPGTV